MSDAEKEQKPSEASETMKTPDWVFHVWMLTTDGSLSTKGDFWLGADAGLTGLTGNLYHRLTRSGAENDNWTNEKWSTVPCGNWVLTMLGTSAMTINSGKGKGIYMGVSQSMYQYQWHGQRYSLDMPQAFPLCPFFMVREERVKFQPV